MVTKEQLSQRLNEKLGTDIEWDRLTKDDLELLVNLVDDGLLLEKLAKHYIKETGKSSVDRALDDWEPGEIAKKLI